MYEKLQKLLDDRGITVYRLAKDIGVPNNRIYDWKKGICRPKMDIMGKIAHYFDVPIEYFLEE